MAHKIIVVIITLFGHRGQIPKRVKFDVSDTIISEVADINDAKWNRYVWQMST